MQAAAASCWWRLLEVSDVLMGSLGRYPDASDEIGKFSMVQKDAGAAAV